MISTAPLPADVRADGAHGRKLYEAALGFEQQLVQTLTSQLAATADVGRQRLRPDDGDDGPATPPRASSATSFRTRSPTGSPPPAASASRTSSTSR